MNKRVISLLSLIALLSGCSNKTTLVFVPYEKYMEERQTNIDYEDDYIYQHKDVSPIETVDGNISSLKDLLNKDKSGFIHETIPNKGERKLLVVPIYFTDSDISNQSDKTIYLQNAFFGDTKRTNYDSLTGYYNKTSYGQIKLTGEVAPWFNLGIASNQWTSIASTYHSASSAIVSKAIGWLKENSQIDFSKYDTDNDGYIDGVYAIYDHPQDKNNKDTLFWAYTYYTRENEFEGNSSAPYLNNYSWTSMDVICQKDLKSYTNYLIHETGHLFGLSDYYNTFTGDSYHYQPTGYFDMMDYNIGDHSSFSKYLLNYVSPKVVKDNIKTTIELKPFIESGDCLLIPSSDYHDSPFGEYLLLEYFSPTGLNKYEGSFSYVDKDGNQGIYRYPNHYGVKIYHVNASLGYYVKGFRTQFICRVDDPDAASKIGESKTGIDYIYSNTITDKEAQNNKPVLYHLLESSGNNTFINSVPANNNTLFKTGSDFGISKFTDFTFDNGEKVNFKMSVKEMSTNKVTLEIETK